MNDNLNPSKGKKRPSTVEFARVVFELDSRGWLIGPNGPIRPPREKGKRKCPTPSEKPKSE